jgi:hypothetical protein
MAQSSMINHEWQVADDIDDRWQMADDRWQMTDDGWQNDDIWQMTDETDAMKMTDDRWWHNNTWSWRAEVPLAAAVWLVLAWRNGPSRVLVAFPGDLVDVVLYRFARMHGRALLISGVSLSVRSSWRLVCTVWHCVYRGRKCRSVSGISCGGGAWLAICSLALFIGRQRGSRARQKVSTAAGTTDGCAEDI